MVRWAMFVVALLSLSTSAEVETAALAADLGVTPYEAGQLVRGALPSVVLRTADGAKAETLAKAMRARGQVALACDLTQVIATEAMHTVRGFRIEADALVSESPNGTSERLPWADVRCAVRAVHQANSQSLDVTHERKFDLTRAVISQGLVMTKASTKEKASAAALREPVLYLFRRGGPPWRLAETQGRYGSLGPLVRPTRLENFETLLRLVRERIPHAPWDERLVTLRPRSETISSDFRGHQTNVSSASTVDLFAHVVATSIAPG